MQFLADFCLASLPHPISLLLGLICLARSAIAAVTVALPTFSNKIGVGEPCLSYILFEVSYFSANLK